MDQIADLNRLLGLHDDDPPDEIERRYELMLAWLESDSVPDELRGWASHQATAVEAAYVELGSSTEPRVQDVEEEAFADVAPTANRVGRVLALGAAGTILGLIVVAVAWWNGWLFDEADPLQPIAATTSESPQMPQAALARIAELESIVASNPEDISALFELGESYMVSENWEGAVQWFTKLLAVEPSNLHARIDIGTANMNLGREAEAHAVFAAVLDLDPDNIQVHYNVAFLYAFSGDDPDLDEAVKMAAS